MKCAPILLFDMPDIMNVPACGISVSQLDPLAPVPGIHTIFMEYCYLSIYSCWNGTSTPNDHLPVDAKCNVQGRNVVEICI